MVTPTIIYVERYYKAKVGHQVFQGNTLKYKSHDDMQRLPKPSPVPPVLFCHRLNDGGIWLCAQLTVLG